MYSPCLSFKVEVSPGADIKDACKEAEMLAARTMARIEFEFNQVTCCMNPGGSAEDLVDKWRASMEEGGNRLRFAVAHAKER